MPAKSSAAHPRRRAQPQQPAAGAADGDADGHADRQLDERAAGARRAVECPPRRRRRRWRP